MVGIRAWLDGQRVLVVDDCRQITSLLSDILTAWGGEVRSVNDAQLAMEVVRTEHFDLAMIDVVLPKIDGWELLRAAVRAQPHLADRIILITGDRWHGDTLRRLHRETLPVLYKPFDLQRLRALICDMLYVARAS